MTRELALSKAKGIELDQFWTSLLVPIIEWCDSWTLSVWRLTTSSSYAESATRRIATVANASKIVVEKSTGAHAHGGVYAHNPRGQLKTWYPL